MIMGIGKRKENKMSEYNITFGTDEKTSHGNGYNNMSVDLNMRASGDDVAASILFTIAEGYPEGQFDMNRTHASKSLSIKEAEVLVAKLQDFITKGKSFLEFLK